MKHACLLLTAMTLLAFPGRADNLEAEGKAEIVLSVTMEDILGNGTGYQMLLDGSHSTYGDIILPDLQILTGEYGDISPEIYDRFNYKIPENADGALSTSNVLRGTQQSIFVEPGVYDFCITNPSPNMWMAIANGEFGRFDDYEFRAGYTYLFEVKLNGLVDIIEHHPHFDLAVDQINVSGLSGSEETISVNLSNAGQQSMTEEMNFCYSINDGEPVVEQAKIDLQPGGGSTYKFTTKCDLSSPGSYKIQAWIECASDRIHYNDTLVSTFEHKEILKLPFTDDFSDESSFQRWTILNMNNDDKTWEHNNLLEDANGGTGIALYLYSWENAANDYMVTPPIQIEQGEINVSFDYMTSTISPENFELMYGTSSDPATMTVIEQYTDVTADSWQKAFNTVDIPEDGTYYFALHAFSEKNMYRIQIDNFNINQGAFSGQPKLTLTNVVLPVSGCDLSTESPVKFVVKNEGTNQTEKLYYSYQLRGNDGEGTWINEEQDLALLPNEETEITFAQTADFSALGWHYVEVRVSYDGEEYVSAQDSVRNFEPITTLPFVSDFTRSDGNYSDWVSGENGGWAVNIIYDGYGSYNCEKENVPLISRCLTLDKGQYRMILEYYMGGSAEEGDSDDFDVLLALSGEDMDKAEVLRSFTNVTTKEGLDTIPFTIEEAGQYVLAVKSTKLSYLNLTRVRVESMKEHDLAIEAFETGLYHMMPVEHFNTQHEFHAKVLNKGNATAEPFDFVVTVGDKELVRKTVEEAILPNAALDVTAEATIANVPVGLAKISAMIDYASDENRNDNIASVEVLVSDSTFATDIEELEDFVDGVAGTSEMTYGNLFHISQTDTLTSITVGLGGKGVADHECDFELSVYKENNLQVELIKTVSCHMSLDEIGKPYSYPFPPTELVAGNYYFEIHQLNGDDLVYVAFDNEDSGYFYYNYEGGLIKVDDYGNIHLRPNFGEVPPQSGISQIDGKEAVYCVNETGATSVFSTEEIAEVSVYDISGRLLHHRNVGTNEYRIDNAGLAEGLNIWVINTTNGKQYKIKTVLRK